MSGRSRWALGVGAAVAVVAATVAIGLATNDGNDVAPAGLELADLEPALLSEDDLGGGWTPRDPDADEPDEPTDPSELGLSPECQEVFEDFDQAAEDDDELAVEFEKDDEDTLAHTLAVIGGDDPTFAVMRQMMDRCGSMTYHDDETDSDVEIRMSIEEADGFGDESFGVTIDVAVEEPLSLEIEGYGVYFTRDGAVTSLVTFGGFDEDFEGTAPDRDLVHELATTVDSRLRDVLADQG